MGILLSFLLDYRKVLVYLTWPSKRPGLDMERFAALYSFPLVLTRLTFSQCVNMAGKELSGNLKRPSNLLFV